MKKELTLIIAVCLLLHLSSLALGGSNEDARRLFNEANALSSNADNKEKLSTAVEKYFQALRIYEQAGNEVGIGATSNALGNVYWTLSEYDKAVESYEHSLAIARKI